MTVAGGTVTVRTRTGRVVTEAVPELSGLAGQVGDRSAVLDGELVAHSWHALELYRLGPRMAARRPALRSVVPLTFMAFDVLWLDGDVTSLAFEERRQLLEGLALTGPAWCTSPSYRGDGPELFAACTRLRPRGLGRQAAERPVLPGPAALSSPASRYVVARCLSRPDTRRPRRASD